MVYALYYDNDYFTVNGKIMFSEIRPISFISNLLKLGTLKFSSKVFKYVSLQLSLLKT